MSMLNSMSANLLLVSWRNDIAFGNQVLVGGVCMTSLFLLAAVWDSDNNLQLYSARLGTGSGCGHHGSCVLVEHQAGYYGQYENRVGKVREPGHSILPEPGHSILPEPGHSILSET